MSGLTADEISEYLKAAKLGLHRWDLFLNLGLAYFGQNEFLKASDGLQLAVLLGPNHLEAHFNLAIGFERQNRLPEALQEIMVSSSRSYCPHRDLSVRSFASRWGIWFVRATNGQI